MLLLKSSSSSFLAMFRNHSRGQKDSLCWGSWALSVVWVISGTNYLIGSSWQDLLSAHLKKTKSKSFESLETCQVGIPAQVTLLLQLAKPPCASALPLAPALSQTAAQDVQMLFSFLLSALFSTSFTTSNNALKKKLWCLLSDEKWQSLGNLFKHIDRKAVISGWHLSLCSHEIYCRWMEQLRSNFLVTSFNRYGRKCPDSPLRSYIRCNLCKCSHSSVSTFLLAQKHTFTSVFFQEIPKGYYFLLGL